MKSNFATNYTPVNLLYICNHRSNSKTFSFVDEMMNNLTPASHYDDSNVQSEKSESGTNRIFFLFIILKLFGK
jgi:hypothetical protein